MSKRKKISRGEPQKRVSEKIGKLRREGEDPKKAEAMAINMERAGRLRRGGRYVRKGKRKGSRQ